MMEGMYQGLISYDIRREGSSYDIRREGRERKEVFVRNVMSARVSDWLADSYYVSHKLERLSAKQKTRRGWLQPPDWSAKCKISTRWLCLRLVSSKRKFSRHFNCLPLPLPLPLPASATATATATATTTTLTATLLLCFCCF